MKKPIGFRSYQNDEEPDKQDELEKQQAERQKAIAFKIKQYVIKDGKGNFLQKTGKLINKESSAFPLLFTLTRQWVH